MTDNESLVKNEISQRLVELCENKAGGNGSRFAKFCRIKQTTMSGYLKGSSTPNIENLINVAKYCQVTVGWLANGEEPKFPGTEKKEQPQTSKIAATLNNWKAIERQNQSQAETTDINLQHIIGWLQEEIEKDKRNSLYYFTDLFLKYPEFQDYMRKKMPESKFPSDISGKQNDRIA